MYDSFIACDHPVSKLWRSFTKSSSFVDNPFRLFNHPFQVRTSSSRSKRLRSSFINFPRLNLRYLTMKFISGSQIRDPILHPVWQANSKVNTAWKQWGGLRNTQGLLHSQISKFFDLLTNSIVWSFESWVPSSIIFVLSLSAGEIIQIYKIKIKKKNIIIIMKKKPFSQTYEPWSAHIAHGHSVNQCNLDDTQGQFSNPQNRMHDLRPFEVLLGSHQISQPPI